MVATIVYNIKDKTTLQSNVHSTVLHIQAMLYLGRYCMNIIYKGKRTNGTVYHIY